MGARAVAVLAVLAGVLCPAAVNDAFAGASPSAQCSITVNVTPTNNTVVSGVMAVRATVTSACQIATVVATVPGQSVNLTFSSTPSPAAWVGSIDVTALPRGQFTLSVTATDVFGTAVTRNVPLVQDERPSISIQSPEVDALARGILRIAATCQDDDTTGCRSLTASLSFEFSSRGTRVASGVTSIDERVSTTSPTSFEGREVWLWLVATDSQGRETIERRRVYSESSARLVTLLQAPGSILDDTADRTLFTESTNVGIFVKATEQVTTLRAGTGIEPACGRLTSAGALFNVMLPLGGQHLFEWNNGQLTDHNQSSKCSHRVSGDFAVWHIGESLYRKNMATGEIVTVDADAANSYFDVAANGEVSYWNTEGIFRYRNGVRTNLVGGGTSANRPGYTATDGINLGYQRFSSGNTISTWLITPDGEVSLDPDVSGGFPVPHKDYALVNGWTAFTRRANASRNVWTRSPTGAQTQRTFFGDVVRIAGLNHDGRVAAISGNRLYVIEMNNAMTNVANSWPQSFWRDDRFHVVVGRVLMHVADCTAVLSSTSVTVGPGAVTATVDVTAAAGCRWDAFTNTTFIGVTSAVSATGNGTVTFAVDANRSGQSRAGSITIAGQVVSITQGPVTNAAIVATPSGLVFGGECFNSSVRSVTRPQTVTVSTAGAALAWTAAANQPWVRITSGAGTGPGAFSVEVGPYIPHEGSSFSATITITASPSGEITTVPVTLIVRAQLAAPIGQVDTPSQNATGVQGAIGITGWALDDFGVTGVKIYRNCLSFENQANCQTVLGYNVVAVGDASFLPGARPDVESAFSTYPENTRAGWGFMVLTSMLPHVTNQRPNGGQGPLTLYAVATAHGTRTLLGRAWDSGSAGFATPTQITMANDSIEKPFGAIDTPAQGQTVSSVLNNSGWALTPDSNVTGGEGGDILIPTNGSTMTVYIDGMPVAQVAYNGCRGNVGNPVPPGVFCNDDVSNIFGNTTPQPVLTTRTSNPTRYRNLDAGRGAIGGYSFNTSTLSNGLHTIAWSVTDSANRTEGIGSRFFIVFNSGGDQPSPVVRPPR